MTCSMAFLVIFSYHEMNSAVPKIFDWSFVQGVSKNGNRTLERYSAFII